MINRSFSAVNPQYTLTGMEVNNRETLTPSIIDWNEEMGKRMERHLIYRKFMRIPEACTEPQDNPFVISPESLQCAVPALEMPDILKAIMSQGGLTILHLCARVSKSWKSISEDKSLWIHEKKQLWDPSIFSLVSQAAKIDHRHRNLMHYIAIFNLRELLPPLVRQFTFSVNRITRRICQISINFPTWLPYSCVALWKKTTPPKEIPNALIYVELPDFVIPKPYKWVSTPEISNLIIEVSMPVFKKFSLSIYFKSGIDPSLIIKTHNQLEETFLPLEPLIDTDSEEIPPNLKIDQWWDFKSINIYHAFDCSQTTDSYPSKPEEDPFVWPPPRADVFPREPSRRGMPAHFTRNFQSADNYVHAVPGSMRSAVDCEGKLPLIYAIEKGYSIASLFAPPLLSIKTKEGKTALHYAAIYNRLENLKTFIQRKNEVDFKEIINIADNEGNTPLFYAVMHGSLDITKLLIENDAKVDISNACGVTPIYYAGQYPEVAKLLIDHGNLFEL